MIINYTQVASCNMLNYRQISKVMRIVIFLLTVLIMQVSAESRAQINVNKKNAPLSDIVKLLSEQSGVDFIYADRDLRQANPVTLKLHNVSLEHALAVCFAGQPLDYTISKGTVLVRRKVTAVADNQNIASPARVEKTGQSRINGTVRDESGLPLEGVTVSVKNLSTATKTEADGNFSIDLSDEGRILVFSLVGFARQEVAVEERSSLKITMHPVMNELEETVVVGYGTQKRSDLTRGNITRGCA